MALSFRLMSYLKEKQKDVHWISTEMATMGFFSPKKCVHLLLKQDKVAEVSIAVCKTRLGKPGFFLDHSAVKDILHSHERIYMYYS